MGSTVSPNTELLLLRSMRMEIPSYSTGESTASANLFTFTVNENSPIRSYSFTERKYTQILPESALT